MICHLHPQEEYGPSVRIFPKPPSILDIITLISLTVSIKAENGSGSYGCKLLYASTLNRVFLVTRFYGNQDHSVSSSEHLQYKIVSKSDEKCRKYMQSFHQINTDRGTDILLNHHSINTASNSNTFQPLKCHFQGV